MNMGERIKELRLKKGLTQEELGKYIGVQKAAIKKYEKGEVENMKRSSIKILSELFGVTASYLMCLDGEKTDKLGNIVVSIPVLGTVRAGYDYLAQENWIDTIELDKKTADTGDFFALKVKGDSMSPIFLEDDIVIIRKQNDCENNQVAVVIINGDEGTLKKVKKTEDGIILQPFNPSYGPVMYTNKEISEIPITIVGVFQELRRTDLKI